MLLDIASLLLLIYLKSDTVKSISVIAIIEAPLFLLKASVNFTHYFFHEK